ncbi:MAG TPA: outer membrane beta-barrel protein [Rickettsiales bacterium]|nr:outer membrane beta-barrel protein [Rickettsiales bacterium]
MDIKQLTIGGFLATALLSQTALADSETTTGKRCDPYNNYACLNSYLGDNVASRFFNYYNLEAGHASAPADPNAPPSHREGWPATPESTPPMPFTEWPYGAATSLGVSRPNSADSPFMAAIANTSTGNWMQNNHIEMYGWLNGGVNFSSNSEKRGGNAPMAYAYTPNTAQLDQAVLYIERVPDTVQTDHIDWGFRLSGIYGENYRYTTSYGIASYQLLQKNRINGYDFPMIYGELYIPNVAEGLLLRAGRYISIPDIEAQLAPNNYMYTHSMSYSFDNYTNEGIVGTLAVKKNLLLQLGIVAGTDSAIWNSGKTLPNLDPNPLYPGSTFKKDPGVQPTLVACARYTWNNGDDNIYPCIDGINNGEWGYNNLQWYGFTYYHNFNDKWHLSYELYDLYQRNVPNISNPAVQGYIANGGTPFSPQYIPFNAPNAAQCSSSTDLTCTANVVATVAYLNYQFSPLDNISFRPEFYDDMEGQRTGVKTRYLNFGLGWQHWLSPQIEFRPEIDYDMSLDRDAFNGNPTRGVVPDRNYTILGAMDVIVHY